MKDVKQKLTLDRPATYQIQVPGQIDRSWTEWADRMTITVEREGDGSLITTRPAPLTRLLCRVCCASSTPWDCR